MKLEKHHYFYLFVGFFFLTVTAVELFSEGMFMDGLFYASIARNMAEGLGSFWTPHFSNVVFDAFYEHPPLAMGLQSLWFKLFGDSIYVERLYSLSTFIIVGYLIVLIWGKITHDKKTGWIPLFLWVITSGIAWSAANNMLENTMSIFVCLSVLFYLNSLEKRRFFWIILAGLSLSLGLLSKGFFCLYIWGVPFFVWIFKRQRSFWQMAIDTVTLIVATILPIALLYFLVPAAQNNMFTYFNKQVLGSIENVKTVNTRFAIVGMFLKSVALPLILSLIIIIVAVKQKVEKKAFTVNIKTSLLFISIVLSGVLPIMISMKQSSFYILTVYPLFAIGLAYYLYPLLKSAISRIKKDAKGFRVFKIFTWGIVLISLVLVFSQINRIGRDKTLILDCKAVIEAVGKNETINICEKMHSSWSIHGYFSRYGNVSLDKNQSNIHTYYLSLNNCNIDNLEQSHELVPIQTTKYKLYKRKK